MKAKKTLGILLIAAVLAMVCFAGAGAADDEMQESVSKSLTDASISISIVDGAGNPCTEFEYVGLAITPDVSAYDAEAGKALIREVDYSLVYNNNTGAGVASVTVNGIGSYTGNVSRDFLIKESDITQESEPQEVQIPEDEEEEPMMMLLGESQGQNNEGVADHIDVTGSITMEIGSTATVSAWVRDSNDNNLGFEPVTFEITEGNSITLTRNGGSDTNYVIVSTTGTTGTTTVKVTAVNHPAITKTFTVTVENGSGNQVRVGCSSGNWDDNTKTLKLTTYSVPGRLYAEITDSYGNVFENKNISWEISDSMVAELTVLNDASNPTKYVSITPKKAGTATITAASADDSNVKTVINLDIEEATSATLHSELPENITDETSGSWIIYAKDNLGLYVADPKIKVEVTSGAENITNFGFSEYTYYNITVGQYVSINPVANSAGNSVTFTVSTTDDRFTTKSLTDTVSIVAVDDLKTKVSVQYLKYNTWYNVKSDVALKTTVESDVSISAYVCDQYNRQTNRVIEWGYTGGVLSADTEVGDNSITLTPKEAGTNLVVTAKDKRHSDTKTTLTYTVEETTFTSVYLYVGSDKLSLHTTTSAEAYARDQYGNNLGEDITWISSNTNIFTVTPNSDNHHQWATITPVNTGTATLTASAMVGSVTKTWSKDITVGNYQITSVNINDVIAVPNSQSITRTIWANVCDQHGNYIDDPTLEVTWDITYTSGDKVISLAEYGYDSMAAVITPEQTGTAKITATCGGITSQECTVTVYAQEAARLEISFNEYLPTGSTRSIWSHVLDQRGYEIAGTSGITLTSSNESVLSIKKTPTTNEPYWTVEGKGDGTATLTASYTNLPDKSVTVTVYVPHADKLGLDYPGSYKSDSIQVPMNSSSGITVWAYIYDQKGNRMDSDSPNFEWSVTSETDVISISRNGSDSSSYRVTGLKVGTAELQVKSGALTLNKGVSVYGQTPYSVDVGYSRYYCVGENSSLRAYVYDENGNTIDNYTGTFTWSLISNDDGAVSIEETTSNECILNALKEGTAKIQVSTGSLTSSAATINVYQPVLTEISVSGEKGLTLAKGRETGIRVYAYDQKGRGMNESASIECAVTSGSGYIEVRQESNNNYFWITGIATGEAKLKFKSGSIESAEITITVYEQTPKELKLSDNYYLPIGNTESIFAEILDQNGDSINYSGPITYELVSGSEYATITENYGRYCLIEGRYVGTAVIKATAGSFTDDANVVVYTPTPTEFYCWSRPINVPVGGLELVEGGIYDQHDRRINNLSSYTFAVNTTSGAENVSISDVMISGSACYFGVTGINNGSAEITVSVNSSAIGKCQVSVYTPEARELSISGVSDLTLENGESSTLRAVVYDQKGYAMTPDTSVQYSWSIVSGNNVISLNPSADTKSCAVTPLYEGTADIRVSDGGLTSKSFKVRVNPQVESVVAKLIISCSAEVPVDSFGANLYVNTYTADNSYIYDQSLPITLEVKNGGNLINVKKRFVNNPYEYAIEGLRAGTATVVAKCGDITSDEFTITVYTPTPKEIRYETEHSNSAIAVGSTLMMYAGLIDNEGRTYGANLLTLTPTSGAEHISLVKNESATQESGLPIHDITGITKGDVTLTITGAGLSKTVTFSVYEAKLSKVKIPVEIYTIPSDGKGYMLEMYSYDQNNCSFDIDTTKVRWEITSGEDVIKVNPVFPNNAKCEITPLKTGFAKIKAVYNGGTQPISSNECIVVVTSPQNAVTPVDPVPPVTPVTPASTVAAPVISPSSGNYIPELITITCPDATAEILYSVNDGYTEKYTKAFAVTSQDTVIVKAVAKNAAGQYSNTVIATYTNGGEPPKYTITVASSTGGSASVDTAIAKQNEMVTVTLTPKNNHVSAGWTITGETTGTVTEKSSSVSKFAMPGENVIITPKFLLDENPKPSSVEIRLLPTTLYETDKGVLNAVTKDQFGTSYSENKVTWTSSDQTVLSINETTGAYTAGNVGSTAKTATVTARSSEDTTVYTQAVLTVNPAPSPYISAIQYPDGNKAYYGQMSDDFIVNSENTTYLNWDWGDGSKNRTQTSSSSHSVDKVAHTFVPTQVGDVTVDLYPSNAYVAEGEHKTATINVVYPAPSNVKITSGPASVVAGQKVTYVGFATGADSYEWRFNDTDLSGNGSQISFTVPTNAPSGSTLTLTAVRKGAESPTSVSKAIKVAQPGGDLGTFGSAITTTPAKPAVGEATILKIDAVDNAVRYEWEIGTTKVSTTASSTTYSAPDAGTVTVTVTAYNSVGESSEPQEFTYEVGKKPEYTVTQTAASGDWNASVTFTAGLTYPSDSSEVTWIWAVDGTKVESATTSSFTKSWTSADCGNHVITVKATSDYGTVTKNVGYKVTPVQGVAPVISGITGPDTMKVASEATFSVIFTSSDKYTIEWYLDDKKVKDKDIATEGQFRAKSLSVGEHSLKVIITTEYEMEAVAEKTITVKTPNEFKETAKDAVKPEAENPQNIRIDDDEDAGTSALGVVDSLSIDSGDISDDTNDVSIVATTLTADDLQGFTEEMGDKNNVLMKVALEPHGLKNEKNLQSSAVIFFQLPKSEVANPDEIEFFRLDTGSEIQKWVKLTKLSWHEKDDFYVFNVKTAGFSTFVATPVATKPDTSSGGGSGSSHKTTKETEIPSTTVISTTETQAIPQDTGIVTLTTTDVVTAVKVPLAILADHPDAQVTVTETNTINVSLPSNVPAADVAMIIEVSVVDAAGGKISVNSPGYFDISYSVPSGKQMIVGHQKANGSWENCSVVSSGGNSWRISYSGLSPFAVVIINAGEENPFLESSPIAPVTPQASSPAPILGLLAGLGAAAVLLKRRHH